MNKRGVEPNGKMYNQRRFRRLHDALFLLLIRCNPIPVPTKRDSNEAYTIKMKMNSNGMDIEITEPANRETMRTGHCTLQHCLRFCLDYRSTVPATE